MSLQVGQTKIVLSLILAEFEGGGRIQDVTPTIYFSPIFKCYFRPYWRCYYSNTDAIIYVVDSADRDRIGISKQELVSMLEEEELKNAILVVLANKQDLEGAMSVTEVKTTFTSQ